MLALDRTGSNFYASFILALLSTAGAGPSIAFLTGCYSFDLTFILLFILFLIFNDTLDLVVRRKQFTTIISIT